MVASTVWQKAEHRDAGKEKDTFNRNRAPMGGHDVLFWPASWRAGQRYDSCVQSAVKRIA